MEPISRSCWARPEQQFQRRPVSRLSIRRIAEATFDEWTTAYEQSSDATFFQGPTWLNLFAKHSEVAARARCVRFEWQDGRVALLPFLHTSPPLAQLRGGVYCSAADTYGGLLASEPLPLENVVQVWRWLLSQAAQARVRPNPFSPSQVAALLAALPGRAYGVSYCPDVTHALPLSSLAGPISSRFHDSHRRATKRARRAGVKCFASRSASALERYWELYTKARKRWGTSAGSHYSLALLQDLAQAPGATLWLAEHNGHTIAGALLLASRTHVAYWHGATDHEAYQYRPLHFLLESAIESARAAGHRYFDFNPSGGHMGVRRFKAGFGADIVSSPMAVVAAPARRLLRG